jgi:hypothetical protein
MRDIEIISKALFDARAQLDHAAPDGRAGF